MSGRMVDDAWLYRATRSNRLGQTRIDPIFDEFVRRFTETSGAAPMALLTDHVDVVRGRVDPRLWVVVETAVDRQYFVEGPIEAVIDRDAALQAMFTRTVPTDDLVARFGLPTRLTWKSCASRLFMVFRDFESEAVAAAHRQVSKAAVSESAADLDLGEQFSCTRRWEPWPPVVFVHTDAQAHALRAAGEPQRWSERYFALVQRFDEFGFISRDDIAVKVDSEETFQRHYQGSSYYYF